MSQEMDALTDQVHANSNAVDSAVVLINGIADRITAAVKVEHDKDVIDPAALDALTTELRAKAATLGAAVVANTPASPATAASLAAPTPVTP